jgi:hypothetical protein
VIRVVAAAVALLGAVPCAAQAIEPGTWPASLHFADGDSTLATFRISHEGRRTMIDVTAPNGTSWTLGNVRADSIRLRFSWAIDGPQAMQCELSRRSAVYWEGHCARRPDRVLVTLKREA